MILPSKHLLVMKTSWRRLEDMPWRRLQNVFSVTIFRLLRRLDDVLEDVLKKPWICLENALEGENLLCWRRLPDFFKTCLQDVFETYIEDVFKTCLQDFFKICLQDVFKTFDGNIYWEYLYLKNLNLCLIDLYLTYLYLTN